MWFERRRVQTSGSTSTATPDFKLVHHFLSALAAELLRLLDVCLAIISGEPLKRFHKTA